MAAIHQLELDEAMARRLQEEEDALGEVEDLSTSRSITARARFRRRPPVRRDLKLFFWRVTSPLAFVQSYSGIL